MAQAAYCSQCGTNVYVGEDGRCPKGHGPESLSNYYEVADTPAASQTPSVAPLEVQLQAPAADPPPPADIAYAESGPTGAAPKSGSKVLVIVAIIIGLLLICGIGSCVAAVAWFNTNADEFSSEFETSLDEALEPIDESETTASEDMASALVAEAENDIPRMVEHFYPWFEAQTYYIASVPEMEGGEATFHIIAGYKNNPDFRITFFAQRTGEADPEGSEVEGQAYYDDESGVWWLHPQTREHALDSVFGPSPLMTESMLDQIATDFVAAHPTWLVTDLSELTNVDLGLAGIDESELEGWYDDGESFETTWKLDMKTAPSRWVEIGTNTF